MKKKFYLSGLHCASCELLIENSIKDVISDAKINVSHKRGDLEIEADNINDDQIKKIVTSCGYKVVNKPEAPVTGNLKKKDWWEIIAIFIGIFLIITIVSKFNLIRFFPDLNRDVSFMVALFIGLVASLSTCLAITGGIVLSFSSGLKISDGHKISLSDRIMPQLYFHSGRIVGFFILGGVLGSLGGVINYSPAVTSFLMILVALIMLYVGLNVMGLLPSITRLGLYLPKSLSRKILNIKTENKPYLITAIGALTFFLPCGFTQSMQVAAVASGSFLQGALIMTFFALGTAPVLFSVGLGSSYAQENRFRILKKIIAAIIILFALYSFNTGLILSGSKLSLSSLNIFSSSKTDSGSELKNGDYQTVQLDINYNFVQKEFKIKKGIPVKFTVNAIRVTGCSDEVIISRLGLTTGKLKNGDQVTLEFTPKDKGVIPFSCWMGMINGRFIVE